MRLLHTRDLEFTEFFDNDRPPYAILSHRWTDGEVSHKQYVDGSYKEGQGITKVRNACDTAFRRGLDWLWVDTICIDKSSSAELSEAINSMWAWYFESAMCMVYFSDVESNDEGEVNSEDIARSEWFDRGWTLQELLAPPNAIFFDAQWKVIGSKDQQPAGSKIRSLTSLLSQKTGIGVDFLTGMKNLKYASIAMRMSWASGRITTRVEDQAYCLLGLFDVNMPLLYGEGKKAFFRLQLEILRNSDDESLFAWRASKQLSGLLADSPRDFSKADSISKMELGPESRVPWSWTNKGLELRILDRDYSSYKDPMPAGNLEQVVYLGCYLRSTSRNAADILSPSLRALQADGVEAKSYIAITIRRFGNSWYRMRCAGFYLDSTFQTASKSSKSQLVYKYYYIPRQPSASGYEEFVKWVGSGSGKLHAERMLTKDERTSQRRLEKSTPSNSEDSTGQVARR